MLNFNLNIAFNLMKYVFNLYEQFFLNWINNYTAFTKHGHVSHTLPRVELKLFIITV